MSHRRTSKKTDGGCGAALLVVGVVAAPIAYVREVV